MKKLTVIAAVMILALPILALAQEEAETGRDAALMERIQKAADLIKTSKEAREAGIPEEEVAEVLKGARERDLSPEETEEVLAESTAAVNEFGPVDNFGAFVQARLGEGLRGRELAAAIHEEHRQRGKGKGKGHGKHKMKEEKRKAYKEDPKGRQLQGDHDDDGDEDGAEHEDDQDQGHGKNGKGGKKEKGKK